MVPPASIRVSRVPMYSGYYCGSSGFVYKAFTFFGLLSQNNSTTLPPSHDVVHNPEIHVSRFGLFPVRSPLLRKSMFLSLPAHTEMFQFRAFPTHSYWFTVRQLSFSQLGFPIRKSPDRWLCAPPRSLSQLFTSFIGSWCQGIHLMLLLAWPVR